MRRRIEPIIEVRPVLLLRAISVAYPLLVIRFARRRCRCRLIRQRPVGQPEGEVGPLVARPLSQEGAVLSFDGRERRGQIEESDGRATQGRHD